jgi:hypothetical protein
VTKSNAPSIFGKYVFAKTLAHKGELAQLVPKKQKSMISYFFEHTRKSKQTKSLMIFGTRAPAITNFKVNVLFLFGELAQLARAPALHAGGQGFDSLILHLRSPKPL